LLILCEYCFVQYIRELEHLANSIGGVQRFPFIHLSAKTSGCHCRRRMWGYVWHSRIASSHTRLRGRVPSWLYLGDIQCSYLWISTIWQFFLEKRLDKSVIQCNFLPFFWQHSPSFGPRKIVLDISRTRWVMRFMLPHTNDTSLLSSLISSANTRPQFTIDISVDQS
jgi:hypothetical protein